MTDILARWKGDGIDQNHQERIAEREWVWVLNKFRIGDVLSQDANVRSIASHWGRFAGEANPKTFLLKDLGDMAHLFGQYLTEKGKIFSDQDINAFLAWKFWEAKIQYQNVICPEFYVGTIAWQKGKIQYAGIFEAFHHAFKSLRGEVANMLFDAIYPVLKAKKEPGKSKIQELKKFCSEVLTAETRKVFDEVIEGKLDRLPQVKEQFQLKDAEEE